MQKEIETPNFSNTPGFAGPVGRVELLGENNSVYKIKIHTEPTGEMEWNLTFHFRRTISVVGFTANPSDSL